MLLHQNWLRQKYNLLKTNEKGSNLFKSKSELKTPQIILKERKNSDNESSDNDNNVDFEFSDIANGDYVAGQYAGRSNVVYHAAVVTPVNNDKMFTVLFFKCYGKKISFLMKMIMKKLVLKVY